MTLYLLRHGKADWPDWKGPDDARPLTDDGIAQMRTVGLALKRMKLAPGLILSSPLPRAFGTAELAALPLDFPVQQHTDLQPGFTKTACDAILAAHPDTDLMLVGHEPDLSTIIRSFTGARVKFPKAALAAIEIDGPSARLLWLFTAKMLIRLYR